MNQNLVEVLAIYEVVPVVEYRVVVQQEAMDPIILIGSDTST